MPDQIRQSTRLYIGGLPENVSKDQIAQRFQPFGTVQAVDLAPEKEGSVMAGPVLKPCRGFAFVQLTPKDDAALHRCISMYNGCKWMGGIMRVEPATLHYRPKLEAEEVEDLHKQQERKRLIEQLEAPPKPKELSPLTIPRRDGRKTMKAVPNRVKTYFPPVKQPRAGELIWDPLEPPPEVVSRRQALLARELSSARALQAQGTMPNGKVAPVTTFSEQQKAQEKASAVAPRTPLVEAAEEEEAVRQASSESEPLAAVDFMDSDAEGPALVHDRRFDSSDDENKQSEPRTVPSRQAADKAAVRQPSKQQKLVGTAQKARLQREQPSEAVSVSTAGRSDSSDGKEGDAAAAALGDEPRAAQAYQSDVSEPVEGTAVMAAVDDSETEGGSESADESDRASRSEQGSEGSEDAAEDNIAANAAGIDGMPRMDQFQDEAAGMAQDQSESEATDGFGEEDGSLGEDVKTSNEHAVDPSAEKEAHAAVGGPELPVLVREFGSDEEEVGAANDLEKAPNGHRSKDDMGQQSTKEILAGLARVLPKGAAFCRLEGGSEVEAAWRAARDSLVADYKSKRRTALKQLPSKKRGRFHA